jgi:hypothetical protein
MGQITLQIGSNCEEEAFKMEMAHYPGLLELRAFICNKPLCL